MAFDYGLARIGVAVGNELTRTARPLEVVHARDDAQRFARVAQLLDEWRPDVLVVGRPQHADGRPLEHTPRCERFARRLHGRHGLPVVLADETLTSHAAAEHVGANEDDDALAAAILLEQWLGDGRGTPVG